MNPVADRGAFGMEQSLVGEWMNGLEAKTLRAGSPVSAA
jgi:hypothetical protein